MDPEQLALPLRPRMDEERRRELALLLDQAIFNYQSTLNQLKQGKNPLDTREDTLYDLSLAEGYQRFVEALYYRRYQLRQYNFGFCKSCGEPIEIKKLCAMPLTRTCKSCDEREFLSTEARERDRESLRLVREHTPIFDWRRRG